MMAVSLLGFFLQCADAAEPMSFRTWAMGGKRPAEVIVAQGQINNDTPRSFQDFLSASTVSRLRPVILLQSPGGSVIGAIELGSSFRKIGAAVIVGSGGGNGGNEDPKILPGVCVSGCVYAFIGGKQRVVPPQSRIGITRMAYAGPVHDATEANPMPENEVYERLVVSLKNYVKAMGLDSHLVDYAEHEPAGQLHLLTRAEIARWNIGAARIMDRGAR